MSLNIENKEEVSNSVQDPKSRLVGHEFEGVYLELECLSLSTHSIW